MIALGLYIYQYIAQISPNGIMSCIVCFFPCFAFSEYLLVLCVAKVTIFF